MFDKLNDIYIQGEEGMDELKYLGDDMVLISGVLERTQ